jgi:hypothetical protein
MEDTNMTTPSKNNAAFKAVKAELVSMVPLAFRSMAKSYIADEHVARILDAALDATQAVRPIKASFYAVRAELISMIPLAFRSTAKPYVTDEHVARILDAALDATQAIRPT